MRRSDRRRWAMPADLAGAAFAFLLELVIVVGLGATALLVAAIVTAVN